MLNVIKEYLVSLGFSVNTSSLNSAKSAMSDAEKSVASFTSSSISNFAKAGIGVATFFATANLGISKFIQDLGQADLQTQIFARRMWLNVDSARAYQNSMKALGVSNLQDLYLSPELLQRYLELRNQSLQMQVPTKEYEEVMRSVRDLTFEFQRLKLEGTYALQWIGYYLNKYLEPIFGKYGANLKSINDLIQQKMPDWTAKVAQVANWFIRMGVAAWNIREALGSFVAVFAGFKLINLGPLGLMIAGLTALLLLVDDFYTYQQGGESVFSKLWQWVEDLKKSLQDNGDLQAFQQNIRTLGQDVVDLVKNIEELFKKLTDKGVGDALKNGIINTLQMLDGILKSISGSLEIINAIIEGFTGGDWGKASEEASQGTKKAISGLSTTVFGPEWGKRISDWFFNTIQNSGGDNFSRAWGNYQSGNDIWSKIFGNKQTSSSNKVDINSNFYITGTKDPTIVAKTVDAYQNAQMTRYFQGVTRP